MENHHKYNKGDIIFYILDGCVERTIIKEVVEDPNLPNGLGYKINDIPFIMFEDEIFSTLREATAELNESKDPANPLTIAFNNRCKDINIDFWVTNHYPLTIVIDRYNGAYSKGKYTAYPVHEWQVPRDHDGGDGVCMDFWNEVDISFVGIGDTPDEAFEDLCEKMKQKQ